MLCTSRRRARSSARERTREIVAAHHHERGDSERERARHRDHRCKGENDVVQANAFWIANGLGTQMHEVADERVRQHEAACATGDSENQALREQHPRQPRAAGAKRETNSELTLPSCRSNERKVREVRACDEKQHTDGAEQQQYWLSLLAIEAFGE